MESYIELLKLMLLEFLIENFNLTSFKNSEEKLHLYFEEQAKPPKEFAAIKLVSKGFMEEITIQDFPLRGQFEYLHIKRRRWTNKSTSEIIKRDWNLVAKGTHMTQEFMFFFKKLIDKKPLDCQTIVVFFGIKSKILRLESFNAKIKA
ncbi:ISAon1 family transposase N-terminal region protein, partial [Flavobacterium psychrophilum]